MDDILFQAVTPLGFSVYVSKEYWRIIVTVKHPVMSGCEKEVKETLTDPDEIRQSRIDPNVYLFYRQRHEKRWVCAVTKRKDNTGFLVTAYPTDKIKEGTTLWKK